MGPNFARLGRRRERGLGVLNGPCEAVPVMGSIQKTNAKLTGKPTQDLVMGFFSERKKRKKKSSWAARPVLLAQNFRR